MFERGSERKFPLRVSFFERFEEKFFSCEGFSQKKNIFRMLAAFFLVISRMIHAYCDLFCLIDFN